MAALKKLGRSPYLVDGYLTRPDEAIAKLGPIDDPLDRRLRPLDLRPAHGRWRRRQGQPAAAGVELLGHLAGAGRALEHRRLARERRPAASRIWTDAGGLDRRCPVHGAARRMVLDRPIRLRHERAAWSRRGLARGDRLADGVDDEIRDRRVLALMLGDTSMGMINGYFGPRLLYPIGFAEHKVDQAWLIDRTQAGQRRSVSTTRFGSCRIGA